MKQHHKKVLAPFMYERANYYYEQNSTSIHTASIMASSSEPPPSKIAANPAMWEGKHWKWFINE